MKRKRQTRKRRAKQFVPRTKREVEVFQGVLAAVSLSRREHLDLRLAAKVEGTNLRTILRYAPSAVEKRKGKYRAKLFDRIPRLLNVIGPKGMFTYEVRSSRTASRIARYLNAVRKFIYKNDASALAEFRSKKIAGFKFITHLGTLKQLGQAGLLTLDRLYAGVTRGR